MTRQMRNASPVIRIALVAALLLQGLAGAPMAARMALADATLPAGFRFIVLCTPDGLKTVARSSLPDSGTPAGDCFCPCGTLSTHIFSALPGQAGQVSPPWPPNGADMVPPDGREAPPRPRAARPNHPRAPPRPAAQTA